MSLFKKRGPEVIDLTQLEKKGTLERSRRLAQEGTMVNTDKVIDFTQGVKRSPQPSESTFDFLGSIAQATQESSSLSAPQAQPSNTFHNRIEDLEYKLERLLEKIQKIEERLENKET